MKFFHSLVLDQNALPIIVLLHYFLSYKNSYLKKYIYGTNKWLHSFTKGFWWKLLLIYQVFVFQLHLSMVNNQKRYCYWVRNIDRKKERKFYQIYVLPHRLKTFLSMYLKCWFSFTFMNTQQLHQNFTKFCNWFW